MNKFDITKHEFSDVIDQLKVNENTDKERIIVNIWSNKWFFFNRRDAIAIAKHFELKAEELREDNE